MNAPHQPRKRFGQNFLVDKSIISHIVAAIKPLPQENLIEIGPGKGALSEQLLASCPQLKAIELDRDLVHMLLEKFPAWDASNLFQADALKLDYARFADGRKIRLVGNLPYNISTPLLFHLLTYRDYILDMYFMLQKEVVDRLAAEPGNKDYGRLSIMVQYNCQVTPLFQVPPTAFRPMPKVLSSVVRLVPHRLPPIVALDEEHFGRIVATAFQQRRKTLRNSLRNLDIDLTNAMDRFDLAKRPEQFSVADFVQLSNCLTPRNG